MAPMARSEKLSTEQTRILASAVAESLPLTVTLQRQNRWVTFRSRFIVLHRNVIWIELPPDGMGGAAFQFVPNEEMGLMFQIGSTRHLFGGAALGQENYCDDAGQEKQAIRVEISSTMRRSQRRLHEREDVPSDWQTRAKIWLGGREAEPDEARVDSPIWSGRVEDLSLGGLLVRVSGEAARYIGLGDIVGICLTFGAEDRSVYLDAQLRHYNPDGEMALIGFQFVDLVADYARDAIEAIAEKLHHEGE